MDILRDADVSETQFIAAADEEPGEVYLKAQNGAHFEMIGVRHAFGRHNVVKAGADEDVGVEHRHAEVDIHQKRDGQLIQLIKTAIELTTPLFV